MKRLLYLFLFLLSFLNLSAQENCVISGFSYELVRQDNQAFFISIDRPVNILQHYFVSINGVPQDGTSFGDGSAVRFGPFPIDCIESYSLKIEKINSPDCNIVVNLGKVCPITGECGFKEIRHDIIECHNNYVSIKLNFEPVNTLGVGFDVYDREGNFIIFKRYEELPVLIEVPIYDTNIGATGITIADNDNDACSASYSFEVDCIPTDECKIYGLEFSYPECNPNGVVYVTLDFKHINTSDGFSVKGNGNDYGSFRYENLPIEIGPFFSNCDKNLEFVVTDLENDKCSDFVGGIVICCPNECQEPVFDIVSVACSDAKVSMKVKLGFELINDAISIYVGDRLIENYEIDYPYLYLQFSNDGTSLSQTLTICTPTIAQPECCFRQSFTLDGCDPGLCFIDDLRYEVQQCNPLEEMFMKLDFNYGDANSEAFDVKGNGVFYGTYRYADLPVIVGPFTSNCVEYYELVVSDHERPDCGGVIEEIKICCDDHCVEPLFEIIHYECGDALSFMKLELFFPLTDDGLKLMVNNQDIREYRLDYPYLYFEFLSTTTSVIGEVSICTVTNIAGEICCYSQEFDQSDCGSQDCYIKELKYYLTPCDAAADLYLVLDFKYGEGNSENFKVNGNGIHYGTFAYSDLPIRLGPFENSCDIDIAYEFGISDAENPECRNALENVRICCEIPCVEPMFFDIISHECNDSITYMKLHLQFPFFSNYLQVTVNDQVIEDYELDFPYLYLVFRTPTPGTPNVITICTAASAGDLCCVSQTFDGGNCGGSGDCFIKEIRYEIEPCDANEVFLMLDFDYGDGNSQLFEVKGNGHHYGTFAYKDLPVAIGPFENNCFNDVAYELGINDVENPDCRNAIEDIRICCDEPCTEPIFEVLYAECTASGGVSMKLELTNGAHAEAYSILINNVLVTDYRIDGHYIYIDYVEIEIQDINYISLCEMPISDLECCYTQAFEVDGCPPHEECRIGDLIIETYVCDDTVIDYVILNFEYDNVGDEGFSVKGNGVDYGDYKYENLPVRFPIEVACDLFYEFVVIDNQFADCHSFIEYGNICCSDPCSFAIDDLRTRCSDGTITEVGFFLAEDTDAVKEYKMYINDEFISTIETNNEFLEFEVSIPIEPNVKYEITVCDDDCCVTEKLDISDCMSTECSITNIETRDIGCTPNGLSFILDFDHVGSFSTRFELYSITGLHGIYTYASLPLLVEDFPFAEGAFNVLFICDNESLCCAAHIFDQNSCAEGLDNGTTSTSEAEVVNAHRYIRQNPANDILYLESPVQKNNYQLFDMNGRIISEFKSDSYNDAIPTGNLNNGIYYVKVRNERGEKMEKLIISK